MLFEKALQYCHDVISGEQITTRYVKKQCGIFLRDLEKQKQEDFPYYFDHKEIKRIEGILSLLNFATGIGTQNKTILEGLVGFQCFFLVSVFGWRFKSDPKKYKHRDNILFIPRKNAKTFICALVVIICMIIEDKFSEMYSCCIDRELAGETKKAIHQIISASPKISKHFTIPKTLSGKVVCKLTNSFYQPRTSNASSNNAVRPSVLIGDEYAAYRDISNWSALKSGMLSVKNPLRFKLTTAYAIDQSIMFDELDYIKKVFDGLIKDDRMFALLYYAEEDHLWDDYGLFQANPLYLEENFAEIRNNRELALNKPKEKEEYLCKHMNHFLAQNSGETYIDIEDLRKCKISEFSWENKRVWIGLDMAMSNDNCSYTMVTVDEDLKIYADSFAFIPQDRIEEKNRNERINYYDYIKSGKCFPCGDLVIDYNFIESMLMDIEKKHGVTIMGISYDRYNCLSTSQKLEKHGYKTIETRQNAMTLHPPTKLLKEKILSQEFFYLENDLLEINFVNSRCVYDANMNMYVNKKKSNGGKVDMVVSLINSLYILMQDVIFNGEEEWAIQVL